MSLQLSRIVKKAQGFRTLKTILLVMVIVFMGVSNSLTAAPTKNLKIKAHMKDGRLLQGRLQQVEGNKLVLYDRQTQQEVVADMDQMSQLQVSKKRNFLPPLLIGTAMGGLTAIISTSGSTLPMYNGLHYILFVPGGLLAGAAGFAFHAQPLNYPISQMSDAEKENLLGTLKNGTWSAVIGKNWYKDGLLGPFRLSWRPFFKHGLNQNHHGSLSLSQGTLPGEQAHTQVFTDWPYHTDEEAHPAGRLHLDYALKDYLFISAEYYGLGDSHWQNASEIKITREGQTYVFNNYLNSTYNAKIFLIGASLGIPNARGILRGLRLETLVGLAASSQKYQSEYLLPQNTITQKRVDPAAQISLSMELFPEESFTTGIFVSYLYAPSQRVALEGAGNAPFYNTSPTPGQSNPPAFRRDIQFDFPATAFNANGFSLGFFLRFR